jgi:hypothetical protein
MTASRPTLFEMALVHSLMLMSKHRVYDACLISYGMNVVQAVPVTGISFFVFKGNEIQRLPFLQNLDL